MLILLRPYGKYELEHLMASLADPLDLPSGVRLPNRIAKAALSEVWATPTTRLTTGSSLSTSGGRRAATAC
jgi:2,4-dienoyl-CoA reductase-like NADH-dependent reductase (Old Yellow Enzyme family)